MEAIFKPPCKISFDGNVAHKWTMFKQQFNNFLLAMGEAHAADKVKIAMVLNLAGDEALEVYNTFEIANADSFDEVIEAFDQFCLPKKKLMEKQLEM